MSNIRRQSIISSLIVYFGFALGFVNTYLYTREDSITQTQYGLINTFIAIANVMYSFASLGMHSYIYKFYPYYNDNLPPRKNDMLSVALAMVTIGFSLIIIAGYLLKSLVIQKYITNAPDLIKYYNWLFPFGFGLTLFSIAEAYAWQLKKSVLTNYLREVQFRLFSTILIILFFAGVIPAFDSFIRFYALSYLLLALLLLGYLLYTKRAFINFSISRVTKKFYRKIVALTSFIWAGGLVYNISSVFDTLVIAAVMPDGLAFAGVYALAQNIASLIQAPQRGIISASIGPLSQAWKDKDMERIRRIYQRSSINQLIFSLGMFSLIYLNFADGVQSFSLKEGYIQALPVFIFIGLMRIIDMGTGVNSQIIGTSIFWRFEFFTGIVLLGMALPLNYILTKQLGVIGPAISNLIAFSIYNGIRYFYLLKKVNLQPFTTKSGYALLIGGLCFAITYVLFARYSGVEWIAVRSAFFVVLYGSALLAFDISPDLRPVLQTIKRKLIRR
jgi:O-antigen/teichoic acid export membrane protein